MTELKLGKRPAEHRPTDLKLARYAIADRLPTPPTRFGFGNLKPFYPDWGYLGNDRFGDCVFAGAGHETEIFNLLRHGHVVKIRDEDALADYSAVTGFDPNDPNSDQGTLVQDAMAYRRKTGVRDALGARHQIAAYVSIDPKDWDLMIQAAFVFGAVGIGIEFPGSAMTQFNRGQIWDVVPGASIEGGHYVPVVGTTDKASRATVITWAKRQEMTKAFYEKYNDEAWVPLSKEMIRTDGLGIHGYDWDTLTADLAAL